MKRSAYLAILIAVLLVLWLPSLMGRAQGDPACGEAYLTVLKNVKAVDTEATGWTAENKEKLSILEASLQAMKAACGDDVLPPVTVAAVSRTPTEAPTETPPPTPTQGPTPTLSKTELAQTRVANITATVSARQATAAFIAEYQPIATGELVSYPDRHIGEKVRIRGYVAEIRGDKAFWLFVGGTFDIIEIRTKARIANLYNNDVVIVYGTVAGFDDDIMRMTVVDNAAFVKP